MKLCLDLAVYWTGRPQGHRAGLLHFFERSLELVGDSLRFYRTASMRKPHPVDADALAMLPHWLGDEEFDEDYWMMYLESGSAPGEPSDRALRFHYDAEGDAGEFRLVLPVDTIDRRGAQGIVDLYAELVASLGFASGLAGYGLNWDYLDRSRAAFRAIRSVSQRYRGIDVPACGSTEYVIPRGIKGPGWLTLLSDALLHRLGGIAALEKALGGRATVRRISGGSIVQAGAMPSIGDVNQRHALPHYDAVGRALAPIRAKGHPAILHDDRGIGDEDITEAWLARFEL